MSIRPTGRLAQRDDGLYLLIDRLFTAPIEDVWHSLTNPTAMEGWIGTYTGNPATGGVKFLMTAEPEAGWQYVSIMECAPPRRFLASAQKGDGEWRIFCHLREAGGMTTLTLGQRLTSAAEAKTIGPGWDYYLDRLIAAREGRPHPDWSHYYPAHADYYGALLPPAH
ncbi:SRPBCC domain-containing protein [Rathayibacter sp. YIM 133350]|uniref:SRPBCC domain-containing protein n=1 Tax=Rathayibacter sp. YIM 133350 TaxID=3131992 RepID=UPI00307E8D51